MEANRLPENQLAIFTTSLYQLSECYLFEVIFITFQIIFYYVCYASLGIFAFGYLLTLNFRNHKKRQNKNDL